MANYIINVKVLELAFHIIIRTV